MNSTNANYLVDVSSTLSESNVYSEDGEMLLREVFEVVATSPTGRRFVHKVNFRCIGNGWGRTKANADATRLAVRVGQAAQKGWQPDTSKGLWAEIRPAYGSEAYSANWHQYAAEDRDL